MEEKKKKLEKIIKQLEKTKDSTEWKRITTEHREEFESIKRKYREKQNQLRNLIKEKKLGNIEVKEFNTKLNKIQDELTELESKIFKMRMGN
ncbi:MAG: hypothetical protein ACTSO9_07780 [Candidatus Helarchaeota archaeon]